MLGGTGKSSRSLRRILVSDNFDVAVDHKHHKHDGAATAPGREKAVFPSDRSKTRPALSGSLTFASMHSGKKTSAVGTCIKKASSSLETVDDFWWSILSLLVILAWSCLCAWGGIYLNDHPDTSQIWIDWISGMTEPVRFLGVLFVFALIFRFNSESNFFVDDLPCLPFFMLLTRLTPYPSITACYGRWYDGRVTWGKIISNVIDLHQMTRSWNVDTDMPYPDTFSRLLITLVYATMDQLRGYSLTDPEGNGKYLFVRHFITKEELDDLKDNPCWEPHYILDCLRALMTKGYGHNKDAGMAYIYDANHKVHGQLLRCYDNAFCRIHGLIGDCIRIRSAVLPRYYDIIHHAPFYLYFLIAPVAWSVKMGWMLPIVVSLLSFLTLAIINLGTELAEPFGKDIVDLPLETYCRTVEVQILEANNRSARFGYDFAENANKHTLELTKRKEGGPQRKMGNVSFTDDEMLDKV